jgi:hypothetical protein
MGRQQKLALAACTAALLLAASVGVASARRIEQSAQLFAAVWTELKFIPVEFGVTVGCNATMTGSFHSRTLSKVAEQLIGYVTRIVIAANCVGGSATPLEETYPWHIRFASFSGTLPNITNIKVRIAGAEIGVRTTEMTCLYISTGTRPLQAFIDIREGTERDMRMDETATIPGSGFPLCPNVRLEGTTFNYTTPSPTRVITVRLVQ